MMLKTNKYHYYICCPECDSITAYPDLEWSDNPSTVCDKYCGQCAHDLDGEIDPESVEEAYHTD